MIVKTFLYYKKIKNNLREIFPLERKKKTVEGIYSFNDCEW